MIIGTVPRLSVNKNYSDFIRLGMTSVILRHPLRGKKGTSSLCFMKMILMFGPKIFNTSKSHLTVPLV